MVKSVEFYNLTLLLTVDLCSSALVNEKAQKRFMKLRRSLSILLKRRNESSGVNDPKNIFAFNAIRLHSTMV